MSEEDQDLSKFERLKRERQKKLAEQKAKDEGHSDLIPDAGYERTQTDVQLDEIIDRIGIIEAYNKWCGKSRVKVGVAQVEGIKVSCPIPGHLDKVPSMWMNTDKDTWFCGKCDIGGDVYDLAAYALDFPVPGYKEGSNFRKLREAMARSYGWTFTEVAGIDKPVLHKTEPEPEKPRLSVVPEDVPEPNPEREPVATVTSISSDDDEDDDSDIDADLPSFNWQQVVEPETFLSKYMACTIVDDVPEEYNFWNGMLGLGLSTGRDVMLYDKKPVIANLFVCLVGYTGDGKSRSFSHLSRLLRDAIPYHDSEDQPSGAKIVRSPASAEALIQSFDKRYTDLTDSSIHQTAIRGLVEYNEMVAFTGRSSRLGNVLKPAVMEFYDGSTEVSTISRTGGAISAVEPFTSMFSTAQPALFREMFDTVDLNSGFMNRWIFATGARKEVMPVGGVQVDTDPAIKPLQDIHGWAGAKRTVTWSKPALDAFSEFFHDVLRPAQVKDTSKLMVRLDLTLKKLMLLFAINEMATEIELRHVQNALYMYDYLTLAYKLLGIEVRKSPYSELQNDILNIIKKQTEKEPHKGATTRDLNRLITRKEYNPSHMVRVLDAYSKLGIIRVEAVNKGNVGRPTIKYFYEA